MNIGYVTKSLVDFMNNNIGKTYTIKQISTKIKRDHGSIGKSLWQLQHNVPDSITKNKDGKSMYVTINKLVRYDDFKIEKNERKAWCLMKNIKLIVHDETKTNIEKISLITENIKKV